MMQTSVRMLSRNCDCDGVFAVAIQIDMLACESSLITISDCQLPIADLVRRPLSRPEIGNWQSAIGNESPSLRRCSDIYVDPLVAAKPSTTKHEQCGYHKNHEDHENCYYSGVRSTTSIVSHLFSSSFSLERPNPHNSGRGCLASE